MANGTGNGSSAAWSRQNVVGLLLVGCLTGGGVFGVTRIAPDAHADCITRDEFTRRLAAEAPWIRDKGEVLSWGPDIERLTSDVGAMREQQASMMTKLDFILEAQRGL